MTSATATTPPSVTFALCVEAGGFESMAVRAIASLRRFGGRFADCPVVAVTPRLGAPLAKSTLAEFKKLGAVYSNHCAKNRYSWYPYVNKVLAALEAQRLSATTHICYLDADMIVIGQPDRLDLADDVDIAACPADKNIGSASETDETTPYWREISKILGLDFDQLPMVHAYRDHVDIKIYFNAGMFCYRASTGFGQVYLDCVNTLLDAKISSKVSNIYFLEQASLGLAAVKSKLNWTALPHQYNYAMGAKIAGLYEPEKVRTGIILHHHDMMWPSQWPVLLEKLKADRPDVHDWLAPQGPLTVPGSRVQQVVSKMFSTIRKKKSARHIAACRTV